MNYSVKHTTSYHYAEFVAVCHNRVHLAPRETDRQTCHDYQLTVSPSPKLITREIDYFGNLVDYFSIHGAYRVLEVTSSSKVHVGEAPNFSKMSSDAWEVVKEQTRLDRSHEGLKAFPLTLPSSRVQISDQIASYCARELSSETTDHRIDP